ncbi:MAG: glycosyltransferase [Xenococcaceae cyanobacterium MO_188.B29]|nr:glycosyltransferase [Xenococcaceae cyanobacterium MO_188.B29]
MRSPNYQEHYNSQIKQLQTDHQNELAQLAENHNCELQRQANDYQSQIEFLCEKNKRLEQQLYSLKNQDDRDLIYLSNLLKEFDALVTSVINSNRWKIGNLFYTIYRKIFLQALDPSLQECQDELRKKIKKWEQRKKRKQNINIINKKNKFKQNIKSSFLLTSSLTRQFSQLKVEKSVSVIILNLNGAKHLNKLLDSLLIHNDYKNFNIIIVDHNSQDGSLKVIDSYKQKLPIKVIPYKENYSYSYSNNRAVEISDSEYLIFLNNDIILTENVIAQIVTYLQDESVGIVGSKLVYPEYDSKFPNEIQHSGIKFFEDIEHGFYRPYNLGVKSGNCDSSNWVKVVPAVTGALMACRRKEFLEIGGFCEDYFYGYEDVDLCLTYLDKLNKLSISNNKVVAIHDESSTQKLDPSKKVRTRRQNNQAVLSKRYGYALKKAWWQDLILGDNFWSDRRLVIAFAVTEASEQAKAGDYFTALELASTCASQFGWEIEFLARDRDWYDLSDVDILIVMVDAYDLSKIYNSKPNLIKIAWLRNWFERWSEKDCFEDYDIYLCSSKKATKYIQEKYRKVAHTFMIATNESRFKSGKVVDKFVSDYCFTGSFWNTDRDIVNVLEPKKIKYQFALYGSGWDKNQKLCSYWRGFIPYAEIPDIYASTKIVIDDANHVTKPWGSVNSRVFDALASGALVITNGVEGATEVFDGILPSYKTPEELHSLLNFYLSNDNERISITSQLREKVLEKHTYTHRACQLQSILSDFCQNKFRIAIKVPVPKIEEVHEWGDYHLALALKRAFKKHGHSVRIDILPDWDTQLGFADDVVLVLRGLSEYTPKPDHINLMWNISHPDKVSREEYERYDHIFVASHHYADKLSKKITTPVSTLLQCTDPNIFYPETNDNIPQEEVLFVGNSRKQFRTIIKNALEVDLQVSVYGTRWENIIPSAYHKGNHIENRKLHYYYSTCKILLNDHWSSMKENGFISNRIFDAAACGCFVISDDVIGATDIFGDTLVTYKNANELKQLVDYFLEHEQERKLISNKLKKIVLSEHTFEHRVLSILDILNSINKQKLKLDKLNIVKANTVKNSPSRKRESCRLGIE